MDTPANNILRQRRFPLLPPARPEDFISILDMIAILRESRERLAVLIIKAEDQEPDDSQPGAVSLGLGDIDSSLVTIIDSLITHL